MVRCAKSLKPRPGGRRVNLVIRGHCCSHSHIGTEGYWMNQALKRKDSFTCDCRDTDRSTHTTDFNPDFDFREWERERSDLRRREWPFYILASWEQSVTKKSWQWTMIPSLYICTRLCVSCSSGVFEKCCWFYYGWMNNRMMANVRWKNG